jgi:hypothetical protein
MTPDGNATTSRTPPPISSASSFVMSIDSPAEVLRDDPTGPFLLGT